MGANRKYTFSRIITYFEYAEENNILRIAFNDGMVFDFLDFPVDKYIEFEQSSSYGKFYLKHIQGKYIKKLRYE